MRRKKTAVLMIFFIIILISLFIITNKQSVEIKAEVLKVDNGELIQSGVVNIGYQSLTVKILEGKHKNEIIEVSNNLIGQLELDNIYKSGEKILVAINKNKKAVAIDHCRSKWELTLFLLFILLLIVYALDIGLKAIFSFIASLFIIWKLLLPGLLAGNDPLLSTLFILFFLAAIIIFSIAGFTKKGLAAFLGTSIGLIVTILITVLFGSELHLNGFSTPYSQVLLLNHITLDIKSIFYASIVIGASGAAMDIAMDIAASMNEIAIKKPEINYLELLQSGFNVGRAVIGTMTTTLLLAYTGGYLTLLMLFLTKNSSYTRIFNYRIVAAEILRTLAGSVGLVMVAPITAFVSAWIFKTNFNDVLRDVKQKILRLDN